MCIRDRDRIATEVSEAAIDRTIEILRKQRRTFGLRAASEGAAESDRVTIDFEGKIDGEPFQGGKAEAFQFIIGEGQMLEQFDQAVRGMKVGQSKTFPLQFPADYHGKDVAGKEADFMVTVKRIEVQNLPVVDEALAKSLGIKEGTVEALRADVRKNLDREVKFRVQARNKAAVMDALAKSAELDLPNALVSNETDRMVEAARADLKQRGVKDADTVSYTHLDVYKRQELGMADTRYVEPTGLSSNNQSSAQDLARLVKASFEHPIIRELSTSLEAVVPVGPKLTQFRNTNGLMRNPEWEIGLQKTCLLYTSRCV